LFSRPWRYAVPVAPRSAQGGQPSPDKSIHSATLTHRFDPCPFPIAGADVGGGSMGRKARRGSWPAFASLSAFAVERLAPKTFFLSAGFPPQGSNCRSRFLVAPEPGGVGIPRCLDRQRARTVLRVRRLLSIPAEPAQGFARRPRRRPFLRGSRVFSPTRPCRGVFGFAQTQQGQDFAGVGGLYYRSQVRRGQGGLTTGGMKRAVEDSSTCGPCGVELMFCRVKINR